MTASGLRAVLLDGSNHLVLPQPLPLPLTFLLLLLLLERQTDGKQPISSAC